MNGDTVYTIIAIATIVLYPAAILLAPLKRS
jgi:hypothetical protein